MTRKQGRNDTNRRAFLAQAAGLATPIGGVALFAGVSQGAEGRAQTGVLNVRELGAVGDGKTDDTASIQAAARAAADKPGLAIHIPVGDYLISSGIVLSEGTHLFGDGPRSRVLVAGGTGRLTDILTISPATVANNRNTGFLLEDFSIEPQSGRPARHAIVVDIRRHPVSDSCFRGLRLGALGGRGICVVPAATPLIDGFFSSVIERCVIYNGVYLDKAGDSIRIVHNTITGDNVGIYVDLVRNAGTAAARTQGGAHGLDITGNNITARGGALLVKNAWAGRFTHNNCEMPNPQGTANSALIDIDGQDDANRTSNFVVAYNMLGAPAGFHNVRVNFARKTHILGNLAARPGGGAFNYKITAAGIQTEILFECSSADGTLDGELSDAGQHTLALRGGIGGRLELTQSLVLLTNLARYMGVDARGSVTSLLGIDSNNIVQIGAFTALATNGHLAFYSQGAEVARLTPDGELLVNTVKPTGSGVKLTVNGAIQADGGRQSFGPNNSGGSGFRVVLVPNSSNG